MPRSQNTRPSTRTTRSRAGSRSGRGTPAKKPSPKKLPAPKTAQEQVSRAEGIALGTQRQQRYLVREAQKEESSPLGRPEGCQREDVPERKETPTPTFTPAPEPAPVIATPAPSVVATVAPSPWSPAVHAPLDEAASGMPWSPSAFWARTPPRQVSPEVTSQLVTHSPPSAVATPTPGPALHSPAEGKQALWEAARPASAPWQSVVATPTPGPALHSPAEGKQALWEAAQRAAREEKHRPTMAREASAPARVDSNAAEGVTHPMFGGKAPRRHHSGKTPRRQHGGKAPRRNVLASPLSPAALADRELRTYLPDGTLLITRTWSCARNGCNGRNVYQLDDDNVAMGCHVCKTVMTYTVVEPHRGIYRFGGLVVECATLGCSGHAVSLVYPDWDAFCATCAVTEREAAVAILNEALLDPDMYIAAENEET